MIFKFIRNFFLPASKAKQAEDKTSEKALQLIDKENSLKELKRHRNLKFRIAKVIYPRNEDRDSITLYFPQVFKIREYTPGFNEEYNERTWWGLEGRINDYGSSVFLSVSDKGRAFLTENEAENFVESFKKVREKEILNEPQRQKEFRKIKKDYQEFQIKKQKEAEKKKPQTTYKEL